MRTKTMTVLAAGVILGAMGMSAANSSIGFVEARGSFQLDGAQIWNNATLFDGTMVETKAVPSRAHLTDGLEMRIAAQSRVRIHQGKVVLEKGAGQIDSSGGYQIAAGAFLISADKEKVVAQVERRGANVVVASAVSGKIRIQNLQGMLVADVAAGNTVTLDPEPDGSAGVTRVSGCVSGTTGELRLVDQTTNLVFAIHGGGVEKEIGNRVEITGSADSSQAQIAGVAQSLKVTGVKRLEAGVCGAADRAATTRKGRKGAGAAGGAAGHGAASTIAIVSGVGVAATAGTLGALGVFAGAQAQPATSR